MTLPEIGIAWTTSEPFALVSKSTGDFITDPTITAGDFKISVAGVAAVNMDTLPVVTPAGSIFVQAVFSAVEMAAGGFAVHGVDSLGVWEDVTLTLNTPAANDETIETQVGTAGAALTDLGGMSTAMKAEVNAELVDVMTVDALAELAQAVPSITPTFATAVMLPYMGLRNKIDITAIIKEVHNDAGTIIATKLLTDDGTTYSEAKMVAGT